MLDADSEELRLVRQGELLGVSRSAGYYPPRPMDPQDLALRRLIDEQYLSTPCYGRRKRREPLRRLGYPVNRKRVQRLRRVRGLEAIYPKPRTSVLHPEHRVYPYLLGGLALERPHQRGGLLISPTGRWPGGSGTWWPLWTGRAARCSPGGYPTAWTAAFVWKPCRKRLPARAVRRSSTPTRAASSPAKPSPGRC